MENTHVPLLIISGPVGVGKTTAGQEVSSILECRGVAHTFVDIDALAETYPRPADDPFANRLALRNLRDVWRNAAAAGSRNLILARVVETAAERAAIEEAIPGCKSVLCQLRATDESLLTRVRRREIGVGLDWHMKRSLELARDLLHAPVDFEIDTTGREPIDVAETLVGNVDWV